MSRDIEKLAREILAAAPGASSDSEGVTAEAFLAHTSNAAAHQQPISIGVGGLSAKLGVTSGQVLTLANISYSDLTIGNDVLKAWTEGGAYELIAITRDSDGVPSSATAVWPDGSAGTWTRTAKNTTWLAIDAYTITHTTSGKTITQAAITRNADGAVTAKPALTVT